MPTFTPNGDGASDTIGFSVDSSEAGSVTGTVRDAGDQSVATISATLGAGPATVTWNGRKGSAYAPDGVYDIGFVAKDLAGNRSEPQVRSVAVYGALGFTTSSKTVFFPQDGDRLTATTSLSFKLFSPATVDWMIQNAAGTTVRTLKAGEALAAGTHAVSWNGRDDAGAYVPRGSYRSVVTATDGTLSSSQRASFVADAFTIAVSDTTPARKQRITVTTTSAESLDAAPRVRVYQPGVAAWSVTMTKVATRVYRATVTLKSGSTGTLRLRIGGHDSNGVLQELNRYLPLH